ncbi:MAG: leucine-rich repeat domain-containing protein [Acetatifactor sp.]|nr:leucine-rich repeat domain-containing protein [Acetatifactor sp.]
MRRKRRLTGILLLITSLVIMSLPVTGAAAGTTASDFVISNNTLTKYKGTAEKVSIPSTVKYIGESAFEDNDFVEEIILPKSVERIGAYAFWDCDKLQTVSLGEGLTEIGDYSFAKCVGLKTLNVPENILYIGLEAFQNCINFTDIYIPWTVRGIHETSFDGCFNLTIHATEGTYAYNYAVDFYRRIQERAEYEDITGSVIVVDPVEVTVSGNDTGENIGENDPSNTAETGIPSEPAEETESLNAWGSVRVVGNSAVILVDNESLKVYGQSPDELETEAETEIDETGMFINSGKSIPKYAFIDGLVVADHAFYNDSSFTGINLNYGITEIGELSYARSALTSAYIPDSVKNIEYGAFYMASGLSDVKLPGYVENVGPKAFEGTAWVNEFENSDEDYLISGNVLVKYKGTEKLVTIPSEVTCIAAEAFKGNTSIQNVVLPDNLKTVGEEAFMGCKSLELVVFNGGLNAIKDRAFKDCPLELANIPSSVTEMGLDAFDKNISVKYMGNIPANTYESSAQRLSNFDLRLSSYGEENQGEAGVNVVGIDGALAELSGADRSYILSISMDEEGEAEKASYRRIFSTEPDSDMLVYDLNLTDGSNISITKLGTAELRISMPVSQNFKDRSFSLFSTDRNGQLESIPYERGDINGVDCVRFSLNGVYSIVFVGGESEYVGQTVTVDEEIVSMSAPDNGSVFLGFTSFAGLSVGYKMLYIFKWILGLSVFAFGMVLVFKRA